MGFWSSLVHSAVQVTHWVANNSGSIASAASIVAKIAGVVALTEDEVAAEGDNILPRLKSDVNKAEDAMLTLAQAQFPQPVVPAGMTLKVLDLPALWPIPSSSAAPKVIPEIGMDINKLLAYNKVPNSLGTDSPVDVGEALANQMFLPPGDSLKLNDGSVFHNAVSFNYKTLASITGGIIFYQIPLGNPGTHVAWHSHIRLHYVYSPDDEKAAAAENIALAIKPTHASKIQAGGSYNSTTLSVQWTGARAIAPVMSAAVQKMIDDAGGNITFLKPAVIDGTRFKYQFQTDTGTGPAEVAAALSSALGQVLPKPDPTHPGPRMPTIKVSNMQTFVS